MIEFHNSSPKKFDKGILKGRLLSFFMVFAIHCLSRIYGTQADIYKKMFNYDKCVESAQKYGDSGQVSEWVERYLEARVELLNKLFLANIREDWEETNRINSEINTLVNERESFISSLNEAFKLTSPYSVDYLEGKGLDEREIKCR